MLEKPPRSSQKLYFLLLWKHLKTHNFTTTNAIVMKLMMIINLLHKSYQHETLGKKKEAGIEIRNVVNHHKTS